MEKLFGKRRSVIGVVHLLPLPGAPRYSSMEAVRRRALQDALALQNGGVDALLFENYGDLPFYPGRVEPHVVACMCSVIEEVRREVSLPFGVNVLRNDAISALAVAFATGGRFVRVNVHAGVRVAGEGVLTGRAHETLRYRALLGSSTWILADISVKHSAPLAEVSLEEEIEANVQRGGADAIIITGRRSGEAPEPEMVRRAAELASVPVVVGSGVSPENVQELLEHADACIVGSWFRGGSLKQPVNEHLVRELMRVVEGLR